MFQQQYARHPVHKSQTPYLVVSFLSVSVSPTTGHQKAIAQHARPQNHPPLLIPNVFQPPLHPLPLLLDRPRPTRPQGRLNHVFGMTRQNFFQGRSAEGAEGSEFGIPFSLFLSFVRCARGSAGEMPHGRGGKRGGGGAAAQALQIARRSAQFGRVESPPLAGQEAVGLVVFRFCRRVQYRREIDEEIGGFHSHVVYDRIRRAYQIGIVG
mmetsp:Transcript_18250/g.37481  ORF Transcript_18250/g.37481 Transcript_18250/m.37481 type:complete len:210 (-) Transcript_18250:1162-1791(-)